MKQISTYTTSILTLLLTSTPLVAIAQTLTGRIVSVGDGDTLRVAAGGRTVTVRLACIDVAETNGTKISTNVVFSGVSAL